MRDADPVLHTARQRNRRRERDELPARRALARERGTAEICLIRRAVDGGNVGAGIASNLVEVDAEEVGAPNRAGDIVSEVVWSAALRIRARRHPGLDERA